MNLLYRGEKQHEAAAGAFGFASGSFKEEEEPHVAEMATEESLFVTGSSGTGMSGYKRAMAGDRTRRWCWRTWQSGQKRGTRARKTTCLSCLFAAPRP